MSLQAHGVKRSRTERVDWESLPELTGMEPAKKKPKTEHSESSSNNSSNNSESAEKRSGFLLSGQTVAQVLQWETEGVELQRAGQHADAFKKFIQAGRDPHATSEIKMRLWTRIANSHHELGEISKSISCYRTALTISGDVRNSLLMLQVSYNLAAALIQRREEQDTGQAIELLKNILPGAQVLLEGDKPLLEKIYAELAFALLMRNADGDALEVVKYASAGIALKPENPDTCAWLLSDLGDGLALLGKHQEAVKCYEKALHLPNEIEEDLKTRLLKHYKRSLSELIELLQTNLEGTKGKEPSPERASRIVLCFYEIATLLLKRKMEGDSAAAIKCFKAALSQEFDNKVLRAQICFYLGLTLMQNFQVNAPEAVKYFDEGLQLLGTSDNSLRFQLLLSMAAAQVAVKNTPGAIKSLETALDAFNSAPLKRASILLRVGMLYKDIKENAKGNESLKKALELAQGDIALQQEIQTQLNR